MLASPHTQPHTVLLGSSLVAGKRCSFSVSSHWPVAAVHMSLLMYILSETKLKQLSSSAMLSAGCQVSPDTQGRQSPWLHEEGSVEHLLSQSFHEVR